MAKFLITGGAGFIGINYLLTKVIEYPQDYFVCLDALTYASNIDALNPLFKCDNFKFIKGNICNKKLVEKLFKEYHFDYVINFAAESHVDRSIKNASIFIKSNVFGTQVLLDASIKYNVKKFHQVSTDEVYGDIEIENNEKLFKENDNLNPSSPYSASKAAADLLVLSYNRTYNLNVSISRCANNYGPFQHKEKYIPTIINSIKNNKTIPIYGTGKNIRDWIYVIDHINAIDLIVRSNNKSIIYNISCHDFIDNIALAKLIIAHFNSSESLIKYVKDRPGHDKKYALDNSLFLKEFQDFHFTSTLKDYINSL